MSRSLDRMLAHDLPVRGLLAVAHLLTFAWLILRTGDILTATAGALILAWAVAVPLALAYLLLYLAALLTASLLEWLQAIFSALHSRDPKAR